MNEKKIIRLDASIMSKSACLRYIYNKVVLGKGAETKPLNDTEFGSAWHVFRETLALTKDSMLAAHKGMAYWKMRESQGMIIKPKKEHLNPDYLMYLFLKYEKECGKEKSWGRWDVLEHPTTGKPMVEQTFSIKFYEDEYCIIFLEGTMDEWVLYPSGFVCIGDDKTSSQWNAVEHLRSFKMKIQLRFYALAIRLMSQLPGGEWYQEVRSRRLMFRINGVYLKSDKEKTEFKMSDPISFEESELDELQMYLQAYCLRLANHVPHFSTPHPEGIFNDSCGGKYGSACEFAQACGSPKAYERILDVYPTKSYQPLMFRK